MKMLKYLPLLGLLVLAGTAESAEDDSVNVNITPMENYNNFTRWLMVEYGTTICYVHFNEYNRKIIDINCYAPSREKEERERRQLTFSSRSITNAPTQWIMQDWDRCEALYKHAQEEAKMECYENHKRLAMATLKECTHYPPYPGPSRSEATIEFFCE